SRRCWPGNLRKRSSGLPSRRRSRRHRPPRRSAGGLSHSRARCRSRVPASPAAPRRCAATTTGRHRPVTAFARPAVMGVLNVTPDSFSDGGAFLNPAAAMAHARLMVAEGADLVDVGGESTRPGAPPVPADEELRRVMPVIDLLAEQGGIPISIDTSKAAVARAAAGAGAVLVNDVTALRGDPGMAAVVAESG